MNFQERFMLLEKLSNELNISRCDYDSDIIIIIAIRFISQRLTVYFHK